MRTYLDANATEPLRPEARAAIIAILTATGNPSSVHAEGRTARRALEDAREAIAARLDAPPDGLVFTSGATEANALALQALSPGRRLIIGATEHDSVRAHAPEAAVLPVDGRGIADLDCLAAMLRDGPALVGLMLANNETGVIQPIPEAAAICHAHGALLHVDAVQAAGRMPASLARLGADSITVSSHKLGGPTGAGALLFGTVPHTVRPLLAGGGQERGWRGGTPALAAIVGFAAALQACGLAERGSAERLAPLRDAIEAQAIAAGAVVAGAGAPRLANTTCLILPGVRADAQVMALDLDGFAISAGAACSSGKVSTSHVLAAMGLGAQAGQAIRVSLPWNATGESAAAFGTAYSRMTSRMRAALANAA